MNYLEAFKQLSSLSAVLCGFSFTFLALLLSLKDYRARTSWSIGMAIVAAAALMLPTFLFAYLSFVWSAIAPDERSLVGTASILASAGFFIGISTLLASLAVAGSIHSKRIGYISSISALAAAVGIIVGIVVLGRSLSAA